ncbi:MAG TPA: hypothetical protein P5513_05000 [Candidatus Diapherotrites archaeon]|nr:hypothetical protein [Candidatus Diapherotrites archaeon]
MTLKEVINIFPNDYDLGEFFASNYNSLDDINHLLGISIIMDHPNYYELGSYLRKEYKNIKMSN